MLQSIVTLAVLTLFCPGLLVGADKRYSSSPGTKPGGNYRQGTLVDGAVDISGQGGEDSAGKVPSDFDAEGEAESRKRWSDSKIAWYDVRRCCERAIVSGRRRQV